MTSESPAPNRNIPALRAYLERNRGAFTDEALTEALLKEGYTKEDVQAGLAWLGVAEASKPVRARARRIVLAAYGITYAVLVIGMLRNGSTAAVGIPV
ncbi:MAG TPA: hypothetical protein VKC59_07560, partial [Candidatus Limnocylindrales bacterium]|nr:hypothetical protein [Candidatus Limnocylindrales bacterium]